MDEKINLDKLQGEQARAETALVLKLPVIGKLASKLRKIYTYKVPSQATDGYNLFINPKFTNKLNFTGKVIVLLHEVLHCLLNHNTRMKGLNHDLANIAADYEVHSTIVNLGIVSREAITKIGGLYDSKFDNLGMETIYDKIKRNFPNLPFTNIGATIDKSEGDNIAKAEGYSVGGGNEDSICRDWKERAIEAARSLKGSNFGDLIIKLTDLYKITKDWKKELRYIIGNSLSPDDSRRAFTNKNILVSQNRVARTNKDRYDAVNYIVAAIDTSGSMSDNYLNTCIKHIYQIANQKKPEKLLVLQFDTEICDIREYTDSKQFLSPIKLKGRGGTNCQCVWDYLKNHKINTELLLVFTDGYLDLLKRSINMINLCWVIIDNTNCTTKYKDAHTRLIYLSSNDFKKS